LSTDEFLQNEINKIKGRLAPATTVNIHIHVNKMHIGDNVERDKIIVNNNNNNNNDNNDIDWVKNNPPIGREDLNNYHSRYCESGGTLTKNIFGKVVKKAGYKRTHSNGKSYYTEQ